ncbi:uncharacterized protein BDR25DRAFT_103182 [Lindgomyces ingoldianus]|uniref:Uncharacterized protein n=1 Tax=Lindgomyces ingoldianus TaxID=673940 RepID=A0ACB6R8U0_9PLEO|nr:uncharacterized protein BDR25DRAFT_103182 [Lindgomyces ingoldianus]KAF2475502.1 hypothetical protein BDR25DRAFT_103182 [Lindgomyces ingoldianus]
MTTAAPSSPPLWIGPLQPTILHHSPLLYLTPIPTILLFTLSIASVALSSHAEAIIRANTRLGLDIFMTPKGVKADSPQHYGLTQDSAIGDLMLFTFSNSILVTVFCTAGWWLIWRRIPGNVHVKMPMHWTAFYTGLIGPTMVSSLVVMIYGFCNDGVGRAVACSYSQKGGGNFECTTESAACRMLPVAMKGSEVWAGRACVEAVCTDFR